MQTLIRYYYFYYLKLHLSFDVVSCDLVTLRVYVIRQFLKSGGILWKSLTPNYLKSSLKPKSSKIVLGSVINVCIGAFYFNVKVWLLLGLLLLG